MNLAKENHITFRRNSSDASLNPVSSSDKAASHIRDWLSSISMSLPRKSVFVSHSHGSPSSISSTGDAFHRPLLADVDQDRLHRQP